MQFKHFHAFMVLLAGCALMSCHSKLDLENVDTTAEIDMGIALPIGSLRATMGDFLGDGQITNVKVDENGIFHYVDTVDIPTKSYHKIDVADYIIKDASTLDFYVKDEIPSQYIQYGYIVGDGQTEVELAFDLDLGMEGINDNLTKERIDSIWVTKAEFVSIINVEDFGLDWDEITKVQLELGEKFRRPGGPLVDIPVSGKGYGVEVPIDVNDFTLSLMKDDSNPDAGTINQIHFRILFYVCPKAGHPIAVNEDSKFSYNLQVKVIDYEALWGYFEAGNQMRDAQSLSLDSIWSDWASLKNLKVRFAEPSIDVEVTHKIAAPLRMYIDYICATDSLGNSTKATWDGIDSTNFDLTHSLSPLANTIGDSVLNTRRFSYDPHEGHIDQLFDVRPDSFSYSFHLLVDQNPRGDYPWKQHRITKDVDVHGFAVADVPFKFNEGSNLQYAATIPDVDLSQVKLESLIAGVEIQDATELKLFFIFKNRIPFDISTVITFLDKDSLDMHFQIVDGEDENIIHLPAPKMEKTSLEKYGRVVEASTSRVIISVDKTDFDRLAEIKYIHFDAAIGDNPEPCAIDVNTDLTVKIGITAQVDAIAKFENLK